MKKIKILCFKKFLLTFALAITIIPSQKVKTLPFLSKIPFVSHVPFIGDNFHAVEKYQFYRSNQLPSKSLKKYINKYGIKSVLNLRGQNDKKWWYKERNACEKMKVQLYNIALTETKLPTKSQIEEILDVFDNAQKPILVHCKSGVDRTGMISALWALDKQHRSKKNALKQLSLFYGHVKLSHSSMTKFINMWQGRDWFFNSYNF
ncbi:tyrosine-protein phosphatase [Candidatus Babeliales bacterium]|nr:tyrosine-protein phosphatase [Candidatus Babeliales bacterium]